MATLFDYPLPDEDCEISEVWSNKFLKDDSGKVVQVRGIRTTPMWNVSLKWQTDAATLAALISGARALKGGQSDCYFYTPDYWSQWDGAVMTAGNGSTLVFPFGGRWPVIGSDVVTVGGTAKVRGTDYEIGVANDYGYSEDLTQTSEWLANSGATVTRTLGRTDPLGGTKACRIQTSGGTATLKLYNSATAGAIGLALYIDVWIKNNGAKTVQVSTYNSADYVNVPANAIWTHVQLSTVQSTGATPCIAFSTLLVADALDFDVWHPWGTRYQTPFGNPTAAWGYVPTTASAVAAETTLGRWQTVYYPGKAPAAGTHLISFRGRRLLLGRITSDGLPRSNPDYQILTASLELVGEEA
jgi:lambda repressor-like predicted transcriptional regulator